MLGLGDVYLGAPVATPLDPRHRLVTTKYNPARTWTPENAVGIGGAYLCVYGMEGPGGYQFVGRTVPDVEPLSRETADFRAGKPWLLRFFDQIRFYPGQRARAALDPGRFPPGESRSRWSRRRSASRTTARFWPSNEARSRRSAPAAGGLHRRARALGRAAASARRARPAAARRWPKRRSPPAGSDPGARHRQRLGNPDRSRRARGGRRLAGVVEKMKMETPVVAPEGGTVVALCCAPGALVRAGQPLLALRPD